MNENRTVTSATVNPVAALKQYGQSVWLDYIRRSLITSGELRRLVDADGLGGVTSNPAIFEKAIDGSNDYAAAIDEISKRILVSMPRRCTSGSRSGTFRTPRTCSSLCTTAVNRATAT